MIFVSVYEASSPSPAAFPAAASESFLMMSCLSPLSSGLVGGWKWGLRGCAGVVAAVAVVGSGRQVYQICQIARYRRRQVGVLV